MSWLYKSKSKIKNDLEISETLPMCPKCYYILLVRPDEKAVYCPMCGEKNLVGRAVRKKVVRK